MTEKTIERLEREVRFLRSEVERLGAQNNRLHAELALAPPDNDLAARAARLLRRLGIR